MAWVGAVAAVAGTVMQFAGQQSSARAYKQQAANEQQTANIQAGQEIAAGQQAADEERRRAALLNSRALAVAASSGRGASDPTATRIMAGITQEGAYRAAVDVYDSESKANYLRMSGQADANIGVERSNAESLASYGGLISSGASLYSKYGNGGPSAYSDSLGG